MIALARRSEPRFRGWRKPAFGAVILTLLTAAALAQPPDDGEDREEDPEQQAELQRRVEELEQRLAELESAPATTEEERKEERQPLVPGKGFPLVRRDWGELNLSLYTYLRYLNQTALDDTYTDSFGRTTDLHLRNDIQLQKVTIYFNGWIYDPRLSYLLYVWTSNTSQGLGAQVVVGGNLSWKFNKHLTLAGGIGGLPTCRSLRGSWPYWLKEDNRTIADEYFRGSYTTGIWASGNITERSWYKLMVGNNLSQLGIDAGQLEGGLDTWSGSAWWMPTTGEFGRRAGYGDFDRHEKLATMFGLSATRSPEDAQSQPGVNDIDNTQIRISDGNIIFTPGVFAPGTQIEAAMYRMASIDAGLKYHGYSLEAEYYRRWIDDFDVRGTGTLPISDLDDHGFQVHASAMALPERLQVYVTGSKIWGEYGDPWDAAVGVNVFPVKREEFRFQVEALRLERSPVGNYSLPEIVGGTGWVYFSNLRLYW